MTDRATYILLGGLSFAGGFLAGTIARKVYLDRQRPEVVPVNNQLAFDFDPEELEEAIPSDASSLFNRIENEKLRYLRDQQALLDSEEPVDLDENPNYRQPRPDPSDIVLATPEEAAQLKDYMTRYNPVTGTTEAQEANVSIFTTSTSTWDYEAELSSRVPNQPYVITKDEYFLDEAGNDQLTFTYYEGDDVLADDHDVPIYNHNQRFPELKFGHGSGDPNVVYIRDESRDSEYEILRHSGLFSVEVEGMAIEQSFEHSASRVPKFRPE